MGLRKTHKQKEDYRFLDKDFICEKCGGIVPNLKKNKTIQMTYSAMVRNLIYPQTSRPSGSVILQSPAGDDVYASILVIIY